MKTYIGVDPGVTGAIAYIAEDGEICAYPMPTRQIPCRRNGKSAHRNIMDRPAITEIFEGIFAIGGQFVVGLERTQARPENARMNDIHAAEARAEISTILSSMEHPAKDIEASVWTAKLAFEGKYWRGALEKRAAWLLEKYPYARQFIVGPQGGIRSGEVDAICIAAYLQLVYGSPLGKWGKRQPRVFGMPESDRVAIKAKIKQEGGLFG